MSIKDVTVILNSRTVHFIVGTICILILLGRLEQLFEWEERERENSNDDTFRKRVGRLTKARYKLWCSV